MTTETNRYQLWINWDEHIASLQPKAGFEAVNFFSQENYNTNLRILLQSGFRFQ